MTELLDALNADGNAKRYTVTIDFNDESKYGQVGKVTYDDAYGATLHVPNYPGYLAVVDRDGVLCLIPERDIASWSLEEIVEPEPEPEPETLTLMMNSSYTGDELNRFELPTGLLLQLTPGCGAGPYLLKTDGGWVRSGDDRYCPDGPKRDFAYIVKDFPRCSRYTFKYECQLKENA